MSEPVIQLRGVSKVFQSGLRRREVTAVDNVDLLIERGSVVAFIGPNGAGKSTTLYLLLGLLKPSSGSIELFGEAPGSVEARRRVGFMSEIFNTYPFHTARRTLSFYGALSGLSGADLDERSPGLLARVGLSDAADRKVGTYSKGMTQRLGLAQALLHRPELLLLDEPTTGLDPEGRRLVTQLISEEQARGTTVFLSSHILSDVERSCDAVVMIRDGSIVFARDLAGIGGDSDEWEIQVTGLTAPLRREFIAAGFPVVREAGEMACLGCPVDRKKELLGRLIESPLEIGTVIAKAGQSLEDLYMQHVGAAGTEL